MSQVLCSLTEPRSNIHCIGHPSIFTQVMDYQYITTLEKISGKRVPTIKFRSLFWNYTDLSCFPIRILLRALKKKLWSRASFRRQPCGRCKIPNLWRDVTWHNRVPETGIKMSHNTGRAVYKRHWLRRPAATGDQSDIYHTALLRTEGAADQICTSSHNY